MSAAPYYQDDNVTLYLGRVEDHLDELAATPTDGEDRALVWDPPYGIAYRTNARGREGRVRSIVGDEDTSLRDAVLDVWEGAAITFGSWKRPKPARTHTLLIWDTKGALGMGDTGIPWKPAHQEIYVQGQARHFTGRRGTDVLAHAPVQSMGRHHPHQKPVPLMRDLIAKTRGVVVDFTCGSGSTLVAAKELGRPCIGVEVDERHAETAATRCAAVLAMPPSPPARDLAGAWPTMLDEVLT